MQLVVRSSAAALLLYGVIQTSGCAVNPATGETQLALISESQEIQMGKQGAEQVRRTMALVDDPALQKYVSDLGQQLAADSERPELPWSFGVVDDPAPNAFALPGGFIYVTRGMLTLMENEAELASVLGHEIAHVTARHSVAQISRAQLAQLGMGVGMIMVPELRPFGDVAGLGMNLLMMKYSRDAEREADELGFGYARAQNYDVREMDDVFAALGRLSASQERSALPGWFATHPAPEERVETIRERAQARAPDADAIVAADEYLARIEGLAYGNNPRNGFFREGTFFHPELRFQFQVPAGWQTQNLARAVVAQAPEGDAVVQLTLGDAESPAEALRKFASQQGVRLGSAGERSINGLAAATAPFQAQTQQAVLGGRVAFIAHRDNVYQLLAFGPAQAVSQRAEVFERTIGSFAPVDDPDILEVEAPRLEVVRLEHEMTLAEFDRRYPSAIDMERLAIINQLEGPQASIPAGAPVKRVVGDPEFGTRAAT